MADSIKYVGTGKDRRMSIRKVTTNETLDIDSGDFPRPNEVDFWVELDTEGAVFTVSQEALPEVIKFLQSKLERKL